MNRFAGGTAVVTGAASGLGLALARRARAEGMRLALADVQADALAAVAGEFGSDALVQRVDVSQAAEVEAFGRAVAERFGAPHLVFNNAGVGAGGLAWEYTAADWAWVLGANLMGVAHGVRVFVPAMLQAAGADAGYEGCVVNTASMAGLVSMPNMALYNASKHAVVGFTETLYQDLALVTDRVTAAVLCPFFVPTGIARSERNRPAEHAAQARTRSQQVAQATTERAIAGGKVSADEVAGLVFDALRAKRFYIYSHPGALRGVQVRMDDLVQGRNPSDPFVDRPQVGTRLKSALK